MDAAARPPAAVPPQGRWWLPVAAAAACATLYLASTVSAFLLSQAGGRTVVGAAVAAGVLAALSVAAVRLSSALGYPGGGAPADVVGRAPSRRVGSAVSLQIGFLVVAAPLLTALGDSLGLRGTTNVPLEHRSAAVVLLVTWAAVAVAPWMEEVSMRGFLLSGLWARIGFWRAAVVSSLVWAALHGVSGVLIPFTFEGIVLCWVRRRTGSTRTGIALHASQNVVATAFSGAGLLVVPALAAAIATLAATRAGTPTAAGRAGARTLAAAGRAADALAARLPVRGSSPSLWVLAGTALVAGLALEAADLELALGGGAVLTLGRLTIAALGLPLLGWMLLAARRTWRAPATTCLAGAAGCAIVVAARAGVLLHSSALVPLVGVGYTLMGFGLLGLAATPIPRVARLGAGAAGLLLAGTLAPLPYLVTSAPGMVDQSLGASILAALAIVAVGLGARRPGTPAPGVLLAPSG
jgi:CAAX protease family protein